TWGTGALRRISDVEPFKDVIQCSPTRSSEKDIAPTLHSSRNDSCVSSCEQRFHYASESFSTRSRVQEQPWPQRKPLAHMPLAPTQIRNILRWRNRLSGPYPPCSSKRAETLCPSFAMSLISKDSIQP